MDNIPAYHAGGGAWTSISLVPPLSCLKVYTPLSGAAIVHADWVKGLSPQPGWHDTVSDTVHWCSNAKVLSRWQSVSCVQFREVVLQFWRMSWTFEKWWKHKTFTRNSSCTHILFCCWLYKVIQNYIIWLINFLKNISLLKTHCNLKIYKQNVIFPGK